MGITKHIFDAQKMHRIRYDLQQNIQENRTLSGLDLWIDQGTEGDEEEKNTSDITSTIFDANVNVISDKGKYLYVSLFYLLLFYLIL